MSKQNRANKAQTKPTPINNNNTNVQQNKNNNNNDINNNNNANEKRSGRHKSQLSGQEYNQLKKVFDFFDKDGNEAISTDEIGSVLKTLGLEIADQELEDIMADLDENGDGIMDFDEFVLMMDRRMSINSQRNEIIMAQPSSVELPRYFDQFRF